MSVRSGPLDRTVDFWKPLLGERRLDELVRWCEPGSPPSPGLNVCSAEGSARRYRVEHGRDRWSLFAAVRPIAEVPSTARVLARIVDTSGSTFSHVLWYPDVRAVVLPFDPDAAIRAFLTEDHVPPSKRTVLPRQLLALYYAVRHLVPSGVSGILRRGMAARAGSAEQFLEWPLDRSHDLLQRLLLQVLMLALDVEELDLAWFWPDGHPWAVVLTHDVETAAGLARAGRIAQLEREYGVRSSFNLVPRDYEVPGSLIRDLRADGFEIGVHGYTHDGLLFSRWTTFLDRIPTINECARRWGAVGFRSPATYRNQEWFHLLEFEYDSSVSNSAPHEPQPGGCASVYPFLVGDMVELPMTLPQDHTLFRLLEHTDAGTWLSVAAAIRDANGMACVLSHPDPAPGYIGVPRNEALYGELLASIVDSGAWTPLPRELARWWRTRAMTPCDRIAEVDGVRRGRAILEPSGDLRIDPPPRECTGAPGASPTVSRWSP